MAVSLWRCAFVGVNPTRSLLFVLKKRCKNMTQCTAITSPFTLRQFDVSLENKLTNKASMKVEKAS